MFTSVVSLLITFRRIPEESWTLPEEKVLTVGRRRRRRRLSEPSAGRGLDGKSGKA